MQKSQTWRELLGKIIENPQERQRIAEELNVSPVTLTRWVKHESNPRLPYLHNLLTVVPKYRNEFIRLIEQEFPDFTARAHDNLLGELTPIPTEFYTRVMHTQAMIPILLRFSSLCDVILQQMLAHLDPTRQGMAVIVAKCMSPSEGNKVRSLRECEGRGTYPWGDHLEQQAILLRSESLAGYSVSFGHTVVNSQLSEQPSLYPGYRGQWEESAAAAPIMRSSQIAGSLLVSSTQPEFFLAEHLILIQNYAELLSIAFEVDSFYDLSRIDLRPMPVAQIQQTYLSGFRQRVTDVLTQAAMDQRPTNLVQAEEQVWREMEEEFFQLSIRQGPESLLRQGYFNLYPVKKDGNKE